MKIRRLAGIAVFLVLLLGILMRIQDGVMMEDPTDANVKAFHELENNSIDVLVIGQSHSWVGIRTDLLNEKGLRSYNYSGNWQKVNTSLAFLQDALITQKPKLVIFDTWNVGVELTTDMEAYQSEMYTTKNIPERKIKQEYLQSVYKSRQFFYPEYEIPLLVFHNNWKTPGKTYRVSEETIQGFSERAGWLENETVEEIEVSRESGEAPLNETGEKYLQEMTKLCRESGAELLLITLPTGAKFGYTAGVRKFAEENQLKYLNYTEHIEESGIDGKTDFYNVTHLNVSGASKATEYLYDYMCRNYDL